MRKKLLLLVCLCVSMLTFSACGSEDPTTKDYNGYTYDQLKSTAQSTLSSLMELSNDDIEQYIEYYESNDQEETAKLIESYASVNDEYGTFVGLGDFTVTKAGKTLTTEQTIKYADRDVIFSIVYNYNSMSITGSNFDAVQSVGEKMSKAGLNTVMGILTVFSVLILISLIIYCFKLIPVLLGQGKKAKAKAPENKPAAASAPAPSAAANVADDTELIAVIAGAIAAATGTSTDSFVVRSIKRR